MVKTNLQVLFWYLDKIPFQCECNYGVSVEQDTRLAYLVWDDFF